MAISTAVGLERKSRTAGYKIKRGNFSTETGNLPQILVVLAEANTANQAGLNTDAKEITSAQEAGEEYGFGSPMHQVFRILRPQGQTGIGGIPTIAIAQSSDVGATATVHEWTVTGTATSNATHRFVIAGRTGLDFIGYDYSVAKDDTPTIIAGKIADAINSVINAPVTASAAAGVVTLTTKWKGETSASLITRVDFGKKAAGVSYSQTSTTDGGGAVDLAGAFAQFNDTWYTGVINTYGEAQLDALEAFNGIPDDEAPTGRWEGLLFKPFMAYFGSTEDDKDNLAAITDDAARVDQVTNVLCPAPGSEAFPWEAAANMVRLFARIMQDTPHLDVNTKAYPDMPGPDNGFIGDMANYENRDFLVKKGCSTVLYENGAYKVQDLVTTYHPAGESPLQYDYARNLNLDWNVTDAYRILEKRFVLDHALLEDDQVTDQPKTIKPIEWKGVLTDLFINLATAALIREPLFSIESLKVEISTVNPNRFETNFRYRRTGIARISSTDVEAGF